MINMKDLIKKQNDMIRKETGMNINEASKIDSREWKKIKDEIEDKIDDLVKIGEDYAVFQSAKHTSKTLKKIQKLWRSL